MYVGYAKFYMDKNKSRHPHSKGRVTNYDKRPSSGISLIHQPNSVVSSKEGEIVAIINPVP